MVGYGSVEAPSKIFRAFFLPEYDGAGNDAGTGGYCEIRSDSGPGYQETGYGQNESQSRIISNGQKAVESKDRSKEEFFERVLHVDSDAGYLSQRKRPVIEPTGDYPRENVRIVGDDPFVGNDEFRLQVPRREGGDERILLQYRFVFSERLSARKFDGFRIHETLDRK